MTFCASGLGLGAKQGKFTSVLDVEVDASGEARTRGLLDSGPMPGEGSRLRFVPLRFASNIGISPLPIATVDD